MEIVRTANAGVLLGLDGKRFLLDGVCCEAAPYLATPSAIREALLRDAPDAVAFTHSHRDHYDGLFVSDYLQNSAGPILGPADIPYSSREPLRLGEVTVTPVESRHIGKTDCTQHLSFVLQGSRCVWFLGDASVLHWQKLPALPDPDVVIAPYGFLLGRGWEYCKGLKPDAVVVLHLPEKANDPYGLWEALEKTLDEAPGPKVLIPAMGEWVTV